MTVWGSGDEALGVGFGWRFHLHTCAPEDDYRSLSRARTLTTMMTCAGFLHFTDDQGLHAEGDTMRP